MKQSNCMLRALALAVLSVVALATEPVTAVVTPAHVSIVNQASATYFDTYRGVAARSISNASRILVRPVFSAVMTKDNQRTVEPGQSVSLAHLVTSVGNVVGALNISVGTGAGSTYELLNVKVVGDLNGNGVADAGEPEVDTTGVLRPGDTFAFVVTGLVPGTAAGNSRTLLEVVLHVEGKTVANNVDTLTSGTTASIVLSKVVDVACHHGVEPGSVLNYQIRATNPGRSTPPVRTLAVDGRVASGILLEDPLPANTSPVMDAFSAEPRTAQHVLRIAGADADTWSPLARWDGVTPVHSIGLLVKPSHLAANVSLAWNFSLRIVDNATNGAQIDNVATIDLDGDRVPDTTSNGVCNRVSSTAPDARPRIRFLAPADAYRGYRNPPIHSEDSAYDDAGRYSLDHRPGYEQGRDGVYLEVHSSMFNLSAGNPEALRPDGTPLTVRVESQLTGDALYVEVVETGANTGVFRSLTPFRLSLRESGASGLCSRESAARCVLRSGSNDRLIASIVDADDTTQLVDVAVVDPYGVVFDAINRDLVSGAEVSVRHADGTLARDPFTDGATPVAPQLTAGDGQYAFPVLFPGRYYLHVVPPRGYTAPSVAPVDTFVSMFEVNDFSYGRDGYYDTNGEGIFELNAGDPPLVVDIPLDPLPLEAGLVLAKSARADSAQIGDVVPYRIDIANRSGAVLLRTRIDDLPPRGLRYVNGSARLDGMRIANPAQLPDGTLQFTVGRMEDNAEQTLEYLLEIGVNAASGNAVNRAEATAESGGGVPARAARTTSTIRVERHGLLSNRSFLFGRAYLDLDADRAFTANDEPVAGVRLYLQDGSYAVSDANGQYSLYGLRPGRHVVQVDRATLPADTHLVLLDNAQAGEASSSFVDLMPGDFHRVNFAVNAVPDRLTSVRAELRRRSKAQGDAWLLDYLVEARAGETARGQGQARRSNGSVFGTPNVNQATSDDTFQVAQLAERQIDPESAILSATADMAQAGTWLWPDSNVLRDGRLIVVVRSGVEPVLRVNGATVDRRHLGAQIANGSARAQILAWYGLELKPGGNDVQVIGTDAFGNERELASKRLYRPGAAASLEIVEQPNAAGGASVGVRLKDRFGTDVSGLEFVTLHSDSGQWLDPDVQSAQPGHQIRLVNGAGQAQLYADVAQQATVSVRHASGIESETRMWLTPIARELMAVGLIDVTARFGDAVADRVEYAEQTITDNNAALNARTALFVKGRIRGDALLTLAYDSGKNAHDELFRDIAPDAYYQVYGDASAKGFEAQSRSRLYVRLEKGAASLSWGDMNSGDQRGSELSRTHYALTGASARYDGARIAATAFVAHDEYGKRVEEFVGNGTAADYRIVGAPILDNSEVVVLITRDRDNPGIVLREEALRRFADYTIDNAEGHLSFHRPVPSVDSDGNPVHVRVAFSRAGRGEAYTISGAGLELQADDATSVAVSAIHDAAPESGFDLLSAGITRTLEHHDIHAAVATTEDNKGVHALALTGRWQARWTERLHTDLKYGRASDAFANAAANIGRDREEFSLDASYDLKRGTTLSAALRRSRTLSADTGRTDAIIETNRRFGNVDLGVGWHTGRLDGPGQHSELNAARVSAAYRFQALGRSGSLHSELEQGVGSAGVLARNRLEVDVADNLGVYIRHDLVDRLAGNGTGPAQRRSAMVFGAHSKLAQGLNAYSELQRQTGSEQHAMAAITGVRGTIEWSPGLTLSPSVELMRPLSSGGDSTDSGVSTALSLGIADRRSETSRRYLRIESRYRDDTRYLGLRGALVNKLNRDWTILVREDLSRHRGTNRELRHTFSLAGAFRPAKSDRYHMLAAYQWKQQRRDTDGDRRTHLISTHHNYTAGHRWDLAARVAGKWQRTRYFGDAFNSRVGMLDARARRQLGTRWEAFIQGGLLAGTRERSQQYSVGVGATYLVRKNVRIGIQYNARGFNERDLDVNNRNAAGFSINLQLKLDEGLFGWLTPSDASLTPADASGMSDPLCRCGR